MSVTLGIANVCALPRWARHAGLSTNFGARAKTITSHARKAGVDILFVQELVTYDNAKLLSRLMGWGGQMVDPISLDPEQGDSCVLKGDGGVAMGFIWNPHVIQPFQLAKTNTYPGWSRNKWSVNGRWHVEGKKCGFACVHFEFEPRGTNNIPKYDKVRYEQMDGLLDQVRKPNQSWIVAGDQNHAFKDKPDAPGDAAKKHGLTQQIDAGDILRGQATKDVQLIGKARRIALGSGSDHPLIVQEFHVPA